MVRTITSGLRGVDDEDETTRMDPRRATVGVAVPDGCHGNRGEDDEGPGGHGRGSLFMGQQRIPAFRRIVSILRMTTTMTFLSIMSLPW